ncbi:hypothetical protein ACFQ3Z_17905 [Streptomyces nogalater]
MDLQTLQKIKPSEYAEAADGYRAISETADAARERVDKDVAKAIREANEERRQTLRSESCDSCPRTSTTHSSNAA